MAEHPTEESINITRKFLGGSQVGQQDAEQFPRLPVQASSTAKKRSFGQRGAQQRTQQAAGDDLISPIFTGSYIPPSGDVASRSSEGSLGERFLGLPGPIGFAKTRQGQAILQRILGGMGRR